jgi:AraC family ethanolamine operon transcriptional activator
MLSKQGYHEGKLRSISTSDVDELSLFQMNKNRRYTQLQAGKLKGDYLEVNLGNVQVFRESINAGTLIEAAPIRSFLPFCAITSHPDNLNYCGKNIEKNMALQATGGYWDVSFKQNLSFVVAAFNREYFNRHIELRTGAEVPSDWLISKARSTPPHALKAYAQGLENILSLVKDRPNILAEDNALRMMTDSILNLLMDVLNQTIPSNEKAASESNKIQGVRQVIDYLHHYANQTPTIAELCKVAKLSERNLQYGFKEYLGTTPVRYLRLVRLNGVKRDLLLAHPKENRIVDIALKWGFIELGRFAGEYRQLFKELPSATLNNVMKNR